MIAAVDVDYREDAVVAACLTFGAWADAVAARELVHTHPPDPAPYEPGSFYKRELPYVAASLRALAAAAELVIVDGYAWLAADRAGLGAHLHDELGVPVIGVAKRPFAGAQAVAVPILRGTSASPLFVTAAGCDAATAAELVRGMHGPHRIPTLLKRVDQLCRGLVAARG